jgi:Flp pilus assembly protein TadD
VGLHFPRTDRTTWGDLSASITWCEYASALSAATDPGDRGHGRGHTVPARLPYVGVEPNETALTAFAEQVRRRPEDETAHRLLGLTQLARGRTGPAVRHLEIALRLVAHHGQRAVGLTDALHLQCEAATLRLMLIPLYMRLGDVARARSLAREAQAVL